MFLCNIWGGLNCSLKCYPPLLEQLFDTTRRRKTWSKLSLKRCKHCWCVCVYILFFIFYLLVTLQFYACHRHSLCLQWSKLNQTQFLSEFTKWKKRFWLIWFIPVYSGSFLFIPVQSDPIRTIPVWLLYLPHIYDMLHLPKKGLLAITSDTYRLILWCSFNCHCVLQRPPYFFKTFQNVMSPNYLKQVACALLHISKDKSKHWLWTWSVFQKSFCDSPPSKMQEIAYHQVSGFSKMEVAFLQKSVDPFLLWLWPSLTKWGAKCRA